jgi:hypothetical protein
MRRNPLAARHQAHQRVFRGLLTVPHQMHQAGRRTSAFRLILTRAHPKDANTCLHGE